MSAAPVVNNTPAKPEANAVVKAGQQIRDYLSRKTLVLPADYSADNALKSAWLILQNVQDLNKRPALQVCTQPSIINALLDMVIQGLNPSKKQCYFIVYGNQLTCQRSYFGDEALAKMVQPDIDLYYDVVYQDDEFEYEKIRGVNFVSSHKQKLENIDLKKIKAAYCGVRDTKTGEDLGCEIMTWEQIQKSWGMSKTYRAEGNGTHNNFPDQMSLRTVIRRRCKPIINSSSDELLMKAVQRQDEDRILGQVDEEEAQFGNATIIELPAIDNVATESPTSGQVETPAEPEKAPEEYDIPALMATLKINEDLGNFVSDQLGIAAQEGKSVPTVGAFLTSLVGQASTAKQIKDALAAVCAGEQVPQPKERGFS